MILKLSVGEAHFIALIEELSKFEGECQRLTFDGLQLTGTLAKQLFRAVRRVQCFPTLEVLEFERIDSIRPFECYCYCWFTGRR
jgi:hypothetical protein